MSLAQDLLLNVIRPTLATIGVDGYPLNLPPQQILLGAAGQESGFTRRRQMGGGPAIGLWEIEPATHDSLWRNFLAYRPALAATIRALLPTGIDATAEAMADNDAYCCGMARAKFLDSPGQIPADVAGQAAYYVRFFNAGGKATAAEYLANWAAFGCDAAFSDLVA